VPIINVAGKAFWDIGHARQMDQTRENVCRPRCLGDSSGDGIERSVILTRIMSRVPVKAIP
jgi:hypothetical protein